MVPENRTLYQLVLGLFFCVLLFHSSYGSAAGVRGEVAAGEGEEQSSLGDLSAQIIKQQDAEEGEGHQEDTAWTPDTEVYSETAGAEPKVETVSLEEEPSEQSDSDFKTLCKQPAPPLNGFTIGDNYDYLGVVRIFCEEGYVLRGHHNITCVPTSEPGSRGVWYPQDKYTCLPTRIDNDTLCKKPEPPENGFITGNDYNDGGVVYIFCETGYTLSGPSNLTCIPVPYPGAPGVWLPEDRFKCLPSYSEVESEEPEEDTASAVQNPSLLPDAEKLKTLCKKPVPPQNGNIKGDNYNCEDVVYIFCDKGYTLSGPSNLTCLPVPYPNTGFWEPQDEYKCLPASDSEEANAEHKEDTVSAAQNPASPPDAEEHKTLCEKPESPQNGYITGDNYDYRAVVHIFCEIGYTLSGPSNLTCLPVPFPNTGIWVPQDEYKCLPKQPDVIEIYSLGEDDNEERPRYSVYNSDDTNNYIIGREPLDEKSLTAFEDVRCPEPTPPEHGSVHGTDYSMGATIIYNCEEGYNLNGPTQATCLAVPDPFHHVAIWDPQNTPKCQVQSHPAPPSTLPLVLIQKSSLPSFQQDFDQRRTDSQPNPNHVEGLPSLCSLQKEEGPCKAALPRYYFDTSVLECYPFTYGGCEGNENNFETYEACQKTCR